MTAQEKPNAGVTRLSFIKTSAGAAAGLATVGVPVAVGREREEARVETKPSGPAPAEPVAAFVRDAKRGEVTVVAGTSQKTYRDRGLVNRLMSAAPQD